MLQPDDGPQFATAKQVFNTNYNGYTPAVIVTPTSQLDVQKAMAFAAANNLKVAPRGGGHSYVGASTANGAMVLDLRQLPGDINYDATTGRVTVTPATGLYAMHQVLAAAGRGIPTGTCPTAAGTPDDMERVLDVARVLLAAEMLGGAEACLDLAVQYAGRRTQFDRPIGSFQAVKHACADMMIEIDATRATVMFAAMSAANGDELQTVAPLAKAQTAETFVLCAGSALQIHGAIAFTWEHDLHLYYRRAKTTEALFGSSARNRALLAERAGLVKA